MKGTPPRTAVRVVAGVVVIGVVALFVIAQQEPEPLPPPPAPAPPPVETVAPGERGPEAGPPDPALVALLDGLTVGDEVNGWKVVNFYRPQNGVAWVELQKGETFFSVGIGARGTGKPPPPFMTQGYEVGYGMVRPRGTGISGSEMSGVAEAIAGRIRKREGAVAKPAGL
ncbi:hypothetical protein [Polyangium aurulentum]|uniref:hypothetical protein n=1 Tax=Polyangium aurulentum TaxID=2567896 RepID=UPI0010ADA61B|nr:hypothetical protein [Polyangium aurulentum]UQA60368.1 hypothetical protein E8A73_007810 [Polyangium aurulentum]